MNSPSIASKVSHLLEHGERLRWTGSSSRWAYLGGHVPFFAFSATFAVGTCWYPLLQIARHDFESITAYSMIFLVISTWMILKSLAAISRDVEVQWAVTDRRVYRIAGDDVSSTDIRQAVSLETNPRTGGQGDLVVHLPEMSGTVADRRYPSVQMRNLDDMKGALGAIVDTIERPLRAA